MSFQPGAVLNTQSWGNKAESVEVPFITDRAPALTDNLYPIGKRWIHKGVAEYSLLSFSTDRTVVPPALVPNWALIVNETISQFISLSDTDNTPAYPTSATALPLPGNVKLIGSAGLSIVAGTNSITFTNLGAGSETITGDDGLVVTPDGTATIGLNGLVVDNATNAKAVFTKKASTSVEDIEIQVGASISAADVTKVGLVNFDSTYFTTDPTTGFTTASSGTVPTIDGQIAIGKTGFPPVAALPTNGTNITWTPGPGSLQANLSGTVVVGNGGTGRSTLTNHGVLIGETTSPVNSVVLAAGQVLIGTTASDPVAANITGDAGITITSSTGAVLVGLTPGGIPNSALQNDSITFNAGSNVQLNGGTTATIELGQTLLIEANVTGEISPVKILPFITVGPQTYQASNSDYFLAVDNNYTITLPTAPNDGQTIVVSLIRPLAGQLTTILTPFGYTFIGAGTSQQMTNYRGSLTFVFIGNGTTFWATI